MKSSRKMLTISILSIMGAAPTMSLAAGVSGDTSTSIQEEARAGGTTELFGYSEQTANGVKTTNATTRADTITLNNRGVPIGMVPIPGFGVLNDGTCIRVGLNLVGVPDCPVAPNVYGPPVAGLRGIAKPPAPPPNLVQAGSSQTGNFVGNSSFNNQTGKIRAAGFGLGTGRAAGAAFDPIMLSPGNYPYQETIDASLQLDGPLDTGDVLFFAVDSRLTDPATFYADGEPLNKALWYLSIDERGTIGSTSDLFDPSKFEVTFKINDRSLLNPLKPDGVTPYTDAQIATAVLDSFTIIGDTAVLQPFTLFPSNTPSPGTALLGSTVYSVGLNPDGTTVIYGAGVNAGLTAVPEPQSIFILATALLGFLGLTARNKRTVPC